MTSSLKNIGNYLIGKTIGEGTFGKVKLGKHIKTNQKVAVKILEKDKIKSKSDLERVCREINILKRLRHPTIIQLYEVGNAIIITIYTVETPHSLYLIMEYATQGDLFNYIVKNTKLNEKLAANLFLQLISGVEYIHSQQVVHRDLKPENLLLDENLNLKIVDFGLSNIYEQGQNLKTACGSPCYAAPEMIAGLAYNGKQIDIWSCGVTLYAMLCGYLPFEDKNTSVLYKKIMNSEYSIGKNVSEEGKRIIKGLLNKDGEKRLKVEEILQEEFMSKNMEKVKLIEQEQEVIDEGILKKLEEYGFEMDYVEQCIRNKRHNNASSSYYLLKKKMKGNKEILEERESRSKREVSISVEKNSSNLFPKNKSIKEIVSARVEYISDNNKMIEEYSGPFHLNQVVCKDESIIMSQILNFISMRNYDLLTVNRYQILFQQFNTRYQIQIKQYQTVYIICFYKLQGSQTLFDQTTTLLLNFIQS